VIVKEDQERRGREPGHIADLIIDGLRDGGLEDGQFETIYGEEEAITHAMHQMRDNDLVVILADNVAGSLDTVRRYSADGAR
jgi:cyanophycin synthetase